MAEDKAVSDRAKSAVKKQASGKDFTFHFLNNYISRVDKSFETNIWCNPCQGVNT